MFDDLRRRFESEVDKTGVTRIASALGISRGTVYNWIASGNAPLDKLLVLRELGLIDVLYVITGDRDFKTLTRDEVELLEQFRAAPLAVKAAAIGALQGGSASPGKTIKVAGDGNQAVGRDLIHQQGVDSEGSKPAGRGKR